MRTGVGFIAVLLGTALFTRPVLADIYTWVDKEGTVHFEDEAPTANTRAKKLESLPERQPRAEPQPAAARPPDEGKRKGAPPHGPVPERPAAKPRVTPEVELYTTSWCPWCKKAREYFNSRGIRFTDHDIEKDAGALERKVGLDGDRHVPTAVIGGKVVKGYSPSGYQAALGQP
jgi:glutaredoxin